MEQRVKRNTTFFLRDTATLAEQRPRSCDLRDAPAEACEGRIRETRLRLGRGTQPIATCLPVCARRARGAVPEGARRHLGDLKPAPSSPVEPRGARRLLQAASPQALDR
eukprot:1105031-Prymnesium_polylepis.1